MANAKEQLTGIWNQLGITPSGTFHFFTYLILFVVFIAGVGVGLYFLIRRLKFNKKIVIFERMGSSFLPSKKDRAMEIRLGSSGDYVFRLRKLKTVIPRPELQTGKNTYWFFRSDDGELLNFTPADFDIKRREMGANFLDKEMRYARTQLSDRFKERYDKTSWLKANAGLLISLTFIILTLIIFWMIMDKYIEILRGVPEVLQSAKEVQEATSRILQGLSNIKGGSGYVPAG